MSQSEIVTKLRTIRQELEDLPSTDRKTTNHLVEAFAALSQAIRSAITYVEPPPRPKPSEEGDE